MKFKNQIQLWLFSLCLLGVFNKPVYADVEYHEVGPICDIHFVDAAKRSDLYIRPCNGWTPKGSCTTGDWIAIGRGYSHLSGSKTIDTVLSNLVLNAMNNNQNVGIVLNSDSLACTWDGRFNRSRSIRIIKN